MAQSGSSSGAMTAVGTLGHWDKVNAPTVTHNPQNIKNGNEWAKYFGEPRISQKVDPYNRMDRSTWVLPEAYRGQSDFLGNTMELLALTGNSFVYNTLLPIELTTALQAHWNRWEFPAQLPDRVPERAVSRTVRSNFIEGSSSMVRWGISISMEHGFMHSPLGQQHYVMHLRQVNQSVNEGLMFQGLFAIATVEDWAVQYLKENGGIGSPNARKMHEIAERERRTFAVLQKTRNAWQTLDISINNMVRQYNRQELTHYVMDSRIWDYIGLVPIETTRYSDAGHRGPDQLRNGLGTSTRAADGQEAYVRDPISGCKIYFTRGYKANDDNPISPMERHVQIGEFFFMRDTSSGDYSDYRTEDRKRQYYDQGTDDLRELTLKKAIKHCARFDPDTGLVRGFDDHALNRGSSNFSAAEKAADPLMYSVPATDGTTDTILKPVSYFGQTHTHHIGLDDYKDAGFSGEQALLRELDQPGQSSTIKKMLNSAQDCIKIMLNTPYDQSYDQFCKAVAAQNQVYPMRQNGTTIELGVGPEYNCMVLPEVAFNKNDPDHTEWVRLASKLVLPPTYCTWAHFNYIADLVHQERWEVTGFSMAKGKSIYEFVTFWKQFCEVVQKFYPGCLLTNPSYAHPWNVEPTPEVTLFENLVMQGFVTVPLFMRPDAAAAGVGGQLPEIKALLQDGYQAMDYIKKVFTGVLNDQNDMFADDQYTKQKEVSSGNTTFKKITNGLLPPIARLAVGENIKGGAQFDLALAQNDSNEVKAHKNLVRWCYLLQDVATDAKSLLDSVTARALIGLTLLAVKTSDDANVWEHFERTMNMMNEELSAGINDKLVLQRDITDVVRDGGYQRYTTAVLDFFSKNKDVARANNNLERAFVRVMEKRTQLDERINKNNLTAADVDMLGSGNEYLRTPMSMGHRAVQTFGNDAAIKDPVAWPGSSLNPSLIMSRHEKENGDQHRMHSFGIKLSAMHLQQLGPVHLAGRISANKVIAESIQFSAMIRSSAARRGANETAPMVSQAIRPPSSRDVATMPSNGGFSTSEAAAAMKRQRSSHAPAVIFGNRDIASASIGNSVYGSSRRSYGQQQQQQQRRSEESAFHDQHHAAVDPWIDNTIPEHMQQTYKDVTKNLNGIARYMAILFMCTRVTISALLAQASNNLVVPYDFIAARPHARYLSLGLTKMIPGLSTGRSLLGHVQVEVGDDTVTQMTDISFRYYSDALITNPKNIANVNHVLVIGYEGGLGSGFMDSCLESYNPNGNEFGNDADDSFFIFLIGRGESVRSNPLSITGKSNWVTAKDYGNNVLLYGKGDLHYSSAAFYDAFYGFSKHTFNPVMDSALIQRSSTGGQDSRSIPNSLCYGSYSGIFSSKTGRYEGATSQTGHWPNNTVGNGMNDQRCGLAPFNNELTSCVYNRLQIVSTVY